MTAIYKALKNSNVSEYVKSRVLNNNLDYILENGVADLTELGRSRPSSIGG
ncbi:TPA: hypothetical protein IX023_001765 [Enterococcus faecium]|nr:hypothetical protein [Enterococcus faecium]